MTKEKLSGDQLRQMREEMGWTQYFLADVLGVSRASLAHWEWERAPVPKVIERAMSKMHTEVTTTIKGAFRIATTEIDGN